MLRSIGAVAVGLLATVALVAAADAVFRLCAPGAFAPGAEPPALVLVLLLACIGAAAAAGSCLTARIAAAHSVSHALASGAMACMLALGATAVLWTTAPAWFHNFAVLEMLPGAWLGAMLIRHRGHLALRSHTSATGTT
jgi:hypothetical protein